MARREQEELQTERHTRGETFTDYLKGLKSLEVATGPGDTRKHKRATDHSVYLG